jgi:dihydroorotate dehydrogenase (fumarate)
MANLKTKYMGLELKSPIIVGANDLVTSIDNLKKIEAAGAGAIVYKSLFEEQVQLENLEFSERKFEYTERNAEMVTLYPETGSDSNGIENHLLALKEAKTTLSIPLIASINAVNEKTWVEYAKSIEKTGVDGLELNFYTSPEKSYGGLIDVESKQLKILSEVKSTVSIPVAVKLSPFYSNPLKLISDMDKGGADAFVLFNKLFQPDIDIKTEEHIYPYSLSNREDSRLPLRFSGMLYGNIRSSICASSGIISGADVIKMLLAGADAVQVVSSLYLNQIDVISKMLAFANSWMDEKGYRDLESFRGKLSEKKSENHPYHRVQYMDFMLTTSEILKKYKAIN